MIDLLAAPLLAFTADVFGTATPGPRNLAIVAALRAVLSDGRAG
jgi:hypothetical protein